jgi:hypothetical protein
MDGKRDETRERMSGDFVAPIPLATARAEYDQAMSGFGRRAADSVSLQAKSPQEGPKP